MEEHDTSSAKPGADSPSADPAVGPLVRLAALAHALEAPGAPAPSLDALCEGLAALGAAEPALERAALVVTAHARAAGLTWPEIAGVQGGRADSLARRHTRRRERFTDYTPPLAPTLEAHTAHAANLLAPVFEERPASPFMSRLAAERLGAVLLTAHWERLDTAAVASWLREDTLSGPRQALSHHHGEQAGAAREALDSHALDPAPVRAWLVERMRAAVGAQGQAHLSSGTRAAVTAVPTGPEDSAATGRDVDALVAIDGGVGVLNVALDHDGGRVKPNRAAPQMLRKLRDAELVDNDGRVTDRGRAALPTALRTHLHQDASDTAAKLPSGWVDATDLLPYTVVEPLTELVEAANLPGTVAKPLRQLRTAATPHLDRHGPARLAILDRLDDLVRSIDGSDPGALADAIGHLPTGGRDLFDATTLAGVGEPLGEVLLALDDHAPASDGQ